VCPVCDIKQCQDEPPPDCGKREFRDHAAKS
jgi:hypothetical protein